MRSFVSFRLTALLCVASAALCLFSPFRESWPAFALLLGLALLAGLGAGGCAKAACRLLWGLLPLLSLALPGSGWMVRAALLALAVYAALFLTLGRFAVETWRYRRSVGILFALCLVLVIGSCFGTGSSALPRLLSAAGLMLALLALRTLQLGASPSARWQAGNAGLFLLPIAGGALVGTALWLSAPLLKYIAYGLSAVLAGFISLWNAFFSWLMGQFSIGEDFFEYTPYEPPTPEVPAEIATEAAPLPSASAAVKLPEVQIPWNSILALLAVAALILLAVWLLRRGVRAAKREKRESGLTEEVLFREPRPGRSRRRQKSTDRTCRGEIRFIYREYLAFLNSRNVRPNRSATTAEISEAAASVLAASDERLREIYRKCRYSAEPVTQEDVRAARASLDGILASKDQSPA